SAERHRLANGPGCSLRWIARQTLVPTARFERDPVRRAILASESGPHDGTPLAGQFLPPLYRMGQSDLPRDSLQFELSFATGADEPAIFSRHTVWWFLDVVERNGLCG